MNENDDYQKPDFLNRPAVITKEKNCETGKEHNSVPYLLMASEGGRRAKSLRMDNGAITLEHPQSDQRRLLFSTDRIFCLATEMDEQWRNGWKDEFHEQLLREGRLTENFVMPHSLIPEIYGKYRKETGRYLVYYQSAAYWFAVWFWNPHGEKRPHRFDHLLYESNPKRVGSDVP